MRILEHYFEVKNKETKKKTIKKTKKQKPKNQKRQENYIVK